MNDFENTDWEQVTKDYRNDWARNHREQARVNERRYQERHREERREASRKYVISEEKKALYRETNRLRYHKVLKNRP